MNVLNQYFILTTVETGNKAYYAFVDTREILNPIQLLFRLHTRVSKTDTDSKKTDTDTIFPNYPGYTDNGYTDIY